jgi:hypothetical protein
MGDERTHKAHKVACALNRKLGIDLSVRRMPLVNNHIAFEFVSGNKSAAYSEAFLETNLAQFATRLMAVFAETTHGHKKGDASRKG